MLRHDTRVTSPKRIAAHSAPPRRHLKHATHPRTKQSRRGHRALHAGLGTVAQATPFRSASSAHYGNRNCSPGHESRHLLPPAIAHSR